MQKNEVRSLFIHSESCSKLLKVDNFSAEIPDEILDVLVTE